jgi:hypothetical protein
LLRCNLVRMKEPTYPTYLKRNSSQSYLSIKEKYSFFKNTSLIDRETV